ncbi:MAG: response regulator [Labilithrix sp.]|nr:response regulator [Labilithrix sp.]MBX3222625.1 response regulator [Labilithrix sp.]
MTQTSATAEAARPILVADDDPEMVNIIVEALTHKGYRVATARHGKEALARVEAEQPRLILLDMKMPVMDGWTFARALHERYGRSIPIVVITALEDSKLRADELGAEGELGKPFSLEQLYDVVEDMLADGGEGAR